MRQGLRRAEDLTPGSRVQSRGDSDTLALPAGTKSVQEPEASVGSSTVAARDCGDFRQAFFELGLGVCSPWCILGRRLHCMLRRHFVRKAF